MPSENELRIAAIEAAAAVERAERIACYASLDEKIDDIREDVGSIKAAILGNGREGLTTRVSLLEADHAARSAVATEGIRGKWMTIATLVTATLALMGSIVTGCATALAQWSASP